MDNRIYLIGGLFAAVLFFVLFWAGFWGWVINEMVRNPLPWILILIIVVLWWLQQSRQKFDGRPDPAYVVENWFQLNKLKFARRLHVDLEDLLHATDDLRWNTHNLFLLEVYPKAAEGSKEVWSFIFEGLHPPYSNDRDPLFWKVKGLVDINDFMKMRPTETEFKGKVKEVLKTAGEIKEATEEAKEEVAA